MKGKYSYRKVPKLDDLIEECIVRNVIITKSISSLKRSDPKIFSFLTSRYIYEIKSRRESLGISKNELIKTCNISLEFLDEVESMRLGIFYFKLENVLEYLRYCRETRHVLHVYKQELPKLKIKKRLVYILLVKTLIHLVLLEEELKIRSSIVRKIKEEALQKNQEIMSRYKSRRIKIGH